MLLLYRFASGKSRANVLDFCGAERYNIDKILFRKGAQTDMTLSFPGARNLAAVKADSIRAVYAALLEEDGLSRADAASRTGLSLMTASKICDALISCGFFLQQKENRLSAGRRAERITRNPDRFFAVLSRQGDACPVWRIGAAGNLLERTLLPGGALPMALLTLYTDWSAEGLLERCDGVVLFAEQLEDAEQAETIFDGLPVWITTSAEAALYARRFDASTLYCCADPPFCALLHGKTAVPLYPDALGPLPDALLPLQRTLGCRELLTENPPEPWLTRLPDARHTRAALPLPLRGAHNAMLRRRLEHLLSLLKA